MKAKLEFKKLGVVMLLLLGTIIFSCKNAEVLNIPETDLTLKSAGIENVVCELTAGQTINAGSIVYEKVGENLIVTYLTTNGWALTEVHLYVGPLSDMPINKKAVQIGHFPYSEENLGGAETWSVSVPLSDGNDCIIAAHAVVYNEELGKEETAWANCIYKPVIAVKVKFPEGKNAESDGMSYIDNLKGGVATGIWCDFLGYNFYEIGSGGDEYLLVNGTHFPSDDAGKVLISDDGSNLMVKIEAKYDMIGSYVFVGSLFDLINFDLNKGCPNYHYFPYIKEWSTPEVEEWIFEIPIPEAQKSYSFESVFGSNRWGWFSYCNFN